MQWKWKCQPYQACAVQWAWAGERKHRPSTIQTQQIYYLIRTYLGPNTFLMNKYEFQKYFKFFDFAYYWFVTNLLFIQDFYHKLCHLEKKCDSNYLFILWRIIFIVESKFVFVLAILSASIKPGYNILSDILNFVSNIYSIVHEHAKETKINFNTFLTMCILLWIRWNIWMNIIPDIWKMYIHNTM